ncbi:MAG: aminopeptidase N C-terminal domain-containing protein [Paracoccaceae bacterium]
MALDGTLDPAFRAAMLRLPGTADIARAAAKGGPVDPDAAHAARATLRTALARALSSALAELRAACRTPGPYDPGPRDAGLRALDAALLSLTAVLDGGAAARAAFEAATDMTRSTAALATLIAAGTGEGALAAFADRWAREQLVMDKWRRLQIALCPPGRALERARALADAPGVDWTSPNRPRSVFGALPANFAGFHRADGTAQAWFARSVARIDGTNPPMASGFAEGLADWRFLIEDRKAYAHGALTRLMRDAPSADLAEMVARMLGGDRPADRD